MPTTTATPTASEPPLTTFEPVFLVPEPILARCRSDLRTSEGAGAGPAPLEKLAVLHRIDTVAGLRAAGHGWLGACFSAMELLTVIYHRHIPDPRLPVTGRNALILSKGHAAMAQYAILSGLGVLPRELLLRYQEAGGLPAHCDRAVPGVDTDSGSLGQGLSKGIGLALAHQAAGRTHRVFVVLGDGELQEGQVFESLLTLKKLNLRACVPIIDRNFLQTDSPTAQIKDAEDWGTVLRGIGFLPLSIDGHDVPAILSALAGNAGPRPLAIVAQTRKGFGTALTTMWPDTPRREGVWHGRIPDRREYLEILEELVGKFGDAELDSAFREFSGKQPAVPASPSAAADGLAAEELPAGRSAVPADGDGRPDLATPAEPAPRSTGDGFGEALVELAGRFPAFRVLDADLEKACRLTAFAAAFPARFLEVGISEQDMVSIAGGLALGGEIAVVNTYASFLKRGLDQIFAVAAERLPVIFAGHYAGIDYFTDGKSHQALQDVGLMRALAELEVYEPLTPGEAAEMLATLLERMTAEIRAGRPSRPAYLRLHRTPVAGLPPLPAAFSPGQAQCFPPSGAGRPAATLFAASPQGLAAALEVQRILGSEGVVLAVVGVSSYTLEKGNLASQARDCELAITLENHLTIGGLADLLAPACRRPPVRLGARGLSGSTRRLSDMVAAQGMEIRALADVVRRACSGRSSGG